LTIPPPLVWLAAVHAVGGLSFDTPHV